MLRTKKKEEAKRQIDEFLDTVYLDVQCAPGEQIAQETLVKLLTKLVTSVFCAWWSIKELMEYIQERQNFKESTYDPGPIS